MMSEIQIGKRIQAIRKERHLSQDQLAELAMLNRVTVAKYESGRIEPGAQALARIADALEVSIDYLLGREDESARPAIDDDVWEVRERLRRDPNFRILFDASKKATAENLRAAAAMLKALEPPEYDE
jgi:transcriptional regulator with XRE-family HTH domain